MSPSANDRTSWYLRISSGVVFGPVPTASLRLWAEQGRVQPGDEISEDRKTWTQAQSLPDLDIAWYLQDATKTLTGPFNRRAAERLISEGRAGDSPQLVHKDDADLSLLARPRGTQNKTQDEFVFDSPGDSAEPQVNDMAFKAEIQELKQQIEELKDEKNKLLGAIEKENRVHGKQLENERKKSAETQQEFDRYRAEQARRLEDEIKIAVIDAVTPLNNKILELQQQLDRAPDDAAQPLLKRIASLEAELRNTQEAAEALQAKAAAETAEPLQETINSLEGKILSLNNYKVDVETAVTNATAPLLVKIDELEDERYAAIEQAVADAAKPLNARISELEERLEENALKERSEVDSPKVSLQTENATLKIAITKCESELQRLSARNSDLEARYAELLAFSNQRDTQATEQLEAANQQIERQESALRVERQKIQRLLVSNASGGATMPSATLISTEKDFLSKLVDDAQRLQKVLKDRILHLSDQYGETASESIVRHAQVRADNELRDAKRELQRQQLENSRIAEKAVKLERDMQQRIRLLETEIDRVKISAIDTDNLRERNGQLIEQIREIQQALSLEKQNHAADMQQLEHAQQALIDKISGLEAERQSLPLKPEQSKPQHQPAIAALNPTGKKFHAPPWMTLKK